MVLLNRAVKIALGSGGILILVWVAILVFGAASINSKDSETYFPSSKQPFYTINDEPDEASLSSPWRTTSLKVLRIPEEAKLEAKHIQVTQQIVKIREMKIYTLHVDPPNRRSDLIFVFLHGAAFTSMEWVHLGTLQLLGALGYTCRAIDLPGFGQTTDTLGAEKDAYMSKVEFFTLLSENMKLDKMVLVTPSMSGHFALPYVLTHPEKVSGLVPIAPAASGIVPPSRLRALQVPTMLLYGDRDTSLGPVSHRDLKKIPNFQAVVIKKAGHAAYLDQPEEFHTLLYNFAQKIEQS